MSEKNNMRSAFWRGLFFGPFAVFPATFLANIFNSIYNKTFMTAQQLADATAFSFMAVGVACLVISTFGVLVWHILLKMQCLSLISLMICSLIPAFITVYSYDIQTSLVIAYYSISVCLLSWYMGLRNVR